MLTCPRCASPLAPDTAGGLCAACLLTAGSETFASASFDELPTVTSHGDGGEPSEGLRLAIDQTWGGYRIHGLLGRGGMGEVYEAEHAGSGRRLALKVLRGRLRPADRARFLREGQLAASISHPHTVYIFGSEEIAGMPVISMELLPGGTLKDRVAADGPLPIEDAVAAVLDIIGGLDAAQASGVLHRDIKPSNCFVDHDGTVKVGDFGLSISTLARDVEGGVGGGGFEGTPQFAPPEQLRGEPLDVRADVYAVGATLYYLLTGHPPFEASDLRELVARVTSEPGVSPRVHRPEVPKALAAIVLQCLAKSAAERPATYAELAEALRPFAPGAHHPANPGLRFVAGALDSVLLMLPVTALSTSAGLTESASAGLAWSLHAIYYLVLEGIWGASLGKRMLGLRVLAADGMPASFWRIAIRTFIFLAGTTLLAGTPTIMRMQPGGMTGVSNRALPLIVLVLLFVTIRRRNGWAAVHDLATRTRVMAVRVAGHAHVPRSAAPAPAVSLSGIGTGSRRGPFVRLHDLEARSGLALAFDPQLRRQVWLREVPAGTMPVSAARRDVARPTRLRWLAARRADGEQWDAFEAPGGEPLLMRLAAPPAWPVLKRWWQDLANELAAAAREGSLPSLGLDRLWVRDDGHLVLLDFAAPGLPAAAPVNGATHAAPSAASETAPMTPVDLMAALLRRAGGDPGCAAASTWPLSARRLAARVIAPEPPPLDAVRDELLVTAASLDEVSRWRRAVPAMLMMAPALVFGIAALTLVPSLSSLEDRDTILMLGWLSELHRPEAERRVTDPGDRAALERYVAGRYPQRLADDRFWNQVVTRSLSGLRDAGRAAVERHPHVEPEEIAPLADRLAAHLAAVEATYQSRALELERILGIIVVALTAVALVLAFVCVLGSSIAVPGGVLPRLLGLAVVGRDGREIGRGRSLLRAMVAWSPMLLWLAYLAASPRADQWVPTPDRPLLSVAVMGLAAGVGLAWLLAHPARGLHDRLLGTTVVPR
jgi:eukaryotic-like serine/threonine-protein kinase